MAAYPHLRIERETPVNERRPRSPPRITPPADPSAHARYLQTSLGRALEKAQEDIGGFDQRRLFKLQVGTLSPEQLEQGFPGVEVLSQEDGGYALVFANDRALEEFEARLGELAAGKKPKYPQILYALQAFDGWTPEERQGWALRHEGLPGREPFVLDVELWPLGRKDERDAMVASFASWLEDQRISVLDRIIVDGLIAYRLQLDRHQAELLLHHRDVRAVDLPPRNGIEPALFRLELQDIPVVPDPPKDAPLVAVLDSGIAGGHPFIDPALGDAQGFVRPDLRADDEEGHGTHVAGIALYGDVEEGAQAKVFTPKLRLLSGRVLDNRAAGDPRFIENIVEEAVRYFYDHYHCRIFNLSYGDLNKCYRGGRVGGLAFTLDRLSRELGVLFIVPTGNLVDAPDAWLKNDYPDYLLRDETRLLDPAPALNALTVGSLARWERGHQGWRWPKDVSERPIARRDQPSPFTRSGASVKGAIKPELVAYGGNQAVDPRTGRIMDRWFGELSTSREFLDGRLLSERSGTSFAAPYVAHLCARLLSEIPTASHNLLRALLIANAVIPPASRDLLGNDEKKLAKLVGYGMVDPGTLYRSTEEQVVLLAESRLLDKHNHFYEIPIPLRFNQGPRRRRRREITLAMAYCPPTRTTRLDYRASRFQFRLIAAQTLEEVVAACDKAAAEDVESIDELGGDKRAYGATARTLGTVQASTWAIKSGRKDKLFVVVTRNDPSWGQAYTQKEEAYALVIRVSDRENEEARLYTEIRTQLQARARARVRE